MPDAPPPSPSTGGTGRRPHEVDEGRVAAVEGPEPLPHPPGTVVAHPDLTGGRRPGRAGAGATRGRGDVSWGPSDPSFPGGTTMVVPPEQGLLSGPPRSHPPASLPGTGPGSSSGMKPAGRIIPADDSRRRPAALRSRCQAYGRREAAGVVRPEHTAHLAPPVDAAAPQRCSPAAQAAPPPPGRPRGRRRPGPRRRR